MSSSDDFFKPVTPREKRHNTEQKAEYFKATEAHDHSLILESVETDPISESETTTFTRSSHYNPGLKWLIALLSVLLIMMLAWDITEFSQILWQQSKMLGLAFSVLMTLLIGSIIQQMLVFRRNQNLLKQTENLREEARRLLNQQQHGDSQYWLQSLQKFYQDQPQYKLLAPCLNNLPDYLNDREVVTSISQDFYQQLDRQATHVIERTCINSASLIAVSQLPVVDSLLVVWNTLKMINQINMIYGVRLNTLSQWRLNLRVAKIALGSYASQAGITFVTEQVGIGLGGKILGSVAQGFSVGLYQARIGISAMQQIRPIEFRGEEKPKLNLFANILRRRLSKLSEQN